MTEKPDLFKKDAADYAASIAGVAGLIFVAAIFFALALDTLSAAFAFARWCLR